MAYTQADRDAYEAATKTAQYAEGVAAFANETACPYAADSDEAYNFMLGFEDAMAKGNKTMTKIVYQGQEFDMDAARNIMDDDICEQIHGTVDTDQEFVEAYAAAHEEKYGEKFVIN